MPVKVHFFIGQILQFSSIHEWPGIFECPKSTKINLHGNHYSKVPKRATKSKVPKVPF